MNAIVTGGNGFIGQKIVSKLVEKGYRVVVLDVVFDVALKNDENVVCIDVKGKELDEINIPEKEYDVFIHLAWLGTSGPLRADYNVQLNNVKNTCDYVILCKKIGCKKIVYASSINEMETYEYLQSDNVEPGGGYIYGAGKLVAHLMGETIAKMNGIEFIPVIITNIYGVGEKSARLIYSSIVKLLKKEHCSFTSGNQTYDFIYITDAINSIIEVAEKGKPFNRYYIGSGNPQPLKNFLLTMKDIVDKDSVLGLGDIPFTGKDISYEQFDMDKVRKDTGYCNKVSFEEGIKLTKEWIENNG